MNIVVSPVSGRPGRFYARLDCGRVLVASAKEPFLAAARVLQAEGVHPDVLLRMQHEGSPIVAMHACLRTAARLGVSETDTSGPRFTRFRDFPHQIAAAA